MRNEQKMIPYKRNDIFQTGFHPVVVLIIIPPLIPIGNKPARINAHTLINNT